MKLRMSGVCVCVWCIAVLQFFAVCCSVLQCVAVSVGTVFIRQISNHEAPHVRCVCVCGVLQCVAVCCSVLQCVAVSVGALITPQIDDHEAQHVRCVCVCGVNTHITCGAT